MFIIFDAQYTDMTEMLQQAMAIADTLPADTQDKIAMEILDEAKWQQQMEHLDQSVIEQAKKALAEHRAGETIAIG